MLTVKENERLTRVGPGTPMGELMRRYWQPIAAAVELDDNPVKQVKLLGESLVLFRGRKGQLGLIGDTCAPRRISMLSGIPAEEGSQRSRFTENSQTGWRSTERSPMMPLPRECFTARTRSTTAICVSLSNDEDIGPIVPGTNCADWRMRNSVWSSSPRLQFFLPLLGSAWR